MNFCSLYFPNRFPFRLLSFAIVFVFQIFVFQIFSCSDRFTRAYPPDELSFVVRFTAAYPADELFALRGLILPMSFVLLVCFTAAYPADELLRFTRAYPPNER